MSWFWRGFQSAIFYYVSCAPCTKLAYQRKRRKQNRREKAEHAAIEEISPEFYQHPSPFSTNIYWREEMVLGPGPPPKKGDRNKPKNGSTRELNTGGYGSSTGASSADSTLVVESLDGLSPVQEDAGGEGWNTRRYQRPDERLWGFDLEAGGMAGFDHSGTGGNATYYTARNPAVNDLHPPVVSTHPTRKSETRWMLQPPPSAKVMEGKERAHRSRSVSGASHRSGKAVSLGRQVGERTLDEKMRRGERPSGEELDRQQGAEPLEDGLCDAAAAQPFGQRHDRDTWSASPSQAPEEITRRQPLPITIAEDPLSQNGIRPSTSENNPLRSPLLAIPSTPQLTQASTQNSPPLNKHLSPAKKGRPHALSAQPSASSLHVLQELISPYSALNARVPSPSQEAGIRLPSATEKEERELRLPELESRFPGGEGYVFPRGERGGTSRGIEGAGRERWSVDV
ncbi:hypothetical protein MMC34_004397 [Xylographa carneopallida]|nr:hypothetical protein [Xylographa carneopallida]